MVAEHLYPDQMSFHRIQRVSHPTRVPSLSDRLNPFSMSDPVLTTSYYQTTEYIVVEGTGGNEYD